MDKEKFEALVWEAIEELPPFFKQKLENVAIVVKDYPGPEAEDRFEGKMLLGLYQGVPVSERSVWAVYPYPDVIYIYQANIEAICRTPEEIRKQILETVIHEIGHYFGLSDEEMPI